MNEGGHVEKVRHGGGVGQESARDRMKYHHRHRYYYGRCECGWRGPNRLKPGRAKDDYVRHASREAGRT